MTFIIILAALIIERFLDWQHVRSWRWLALYQRQVAVITGRMPTFVQLLLIILPPVLLIGLLNGLLTGLFFNFFKLIFGIAVLIYCLGPENFWAQVYKTISLFHLEEKASATAQMLQAFPVPVAVNFTQRIFIEANRRVFAVIFWFLILGPVGALLYRLVDLLRMQSSQYYAEGVKLQGWLDWLPVRVLTVLFALAGHFNDVVKQWKTSFLSSPALNEIFLAQCGIAALDVAQNGVLPDDGSAEKEALSLLDRAFVIGLVILAVLVLLK